MSARHGLLEQANGAAAVPIEAVERADFSVWLEKHSPERKRWIEASGFSAEPGTSCLIPAANGGLAAVALGVGGSSVGGSGGVSEMWDWAALPTTLPPGLYRVAASPTPRRADSAATGWGFGAYRFSRYSKADREPSSLIWPHDCDRPMVERTVEATAMVRDLINTPACDMGPEDLAAVAQRLAADYGARSGVIVGDELIKRGFPAIHAVGRASSRAPRLIDLTWGDEVHPKVTLVGKGVCFDSGGLDIKTSAGMKLMKKDMGGGAIMLGLARMIMDAGMPIRLRLLIPAVENSISGNAIRPLDVVTTRKGLSIEIGNTDAEGRVILADALCEAASENPSMLIDCATLTGAARVALGPELPALFSNDGALADDLVASGRTVDDPLWRLPLWRPYRRLVDGKTADLTNAPDSPFAGAITAALFLAEFVEPVTAWVHIDVMAWNVTSRPGRPEGGEASSMRALYGLIAKRFPA